MTAREWKPGDAAVLTCEDETCPAREHPGLLAKSERWYLLDVGEYVDPHGAEPARPLAVIDPEDREQVERLAAECRRAFGWTSGIEDGDADATQAALREFANPTPPKPEEPTGLGAVVEDAEGDIWVRVDGDAISLWHHGGRFPKKWQDITAVRVLSEGVTA